MSSDRRLALGFFAIALVVHAAFAGTIAGPEDWDAQYYALVARHVAAGEGAITRGLWNLSFLPAALPCPADLHWMPLPSRVLVPGVCLWPAHGAALVSVILAAAWSPIAFALARASGRDVQVAAVAALLAATGGAFARLLSTSDTYALYGAIGGLGALCVARGNVAGAILAAVLAALARNDGWLLGFAIAAGLAPRGILPVIAASASTIGTAGAWALRNVRIGGAAIAQARRIALGTTSYLDVFDGVLRHPASGLARVAALVHALPTLCAHWLALGLGLGVPAAIVGWKLLRAQAWSRAFAAFVVLGPVVAVLAAPAVALHGTIPRLLAGAGPVVAVWIAIGLDGIGEWSARVRGYSRVFLPATLGAACVLAALGLGIRRVLDAERSIAPCAAIADLPAGVPIFSSDPLAIEAACDRPAVMITRTLSPERAAEIARRYGITRALTRSDDDEGSLRDADVPAVLPGWVRVAPGRWDAPRR